MIIRTAGSVLSVSVAAVVLAAVMAPGAPSSALPCAAEDEVIFNGECVHVDGLPLVPASARGALSSR